MAPTSSRIPMPTPAGASEFGAGNPFSFIQGDFEGRRLRLQLEELQKADRARKYARKDRRPLDPPPVARLRIFEVSTQGGREVEEELEDPESDISSIGLMCHVDLFPVPDGDRDQHKDPQELDSDDNDEDDDEDSSTRTHSSAGDQQAHASYTYQTQSSLQQIHGHTPSSTYSSGTFPSQSNVPVLMPASWPPHYSASASGVMHTFPPTAAHPAAYSGYSPQFTGYPPPPPLPPRRQISEVRPLLPPRPPGLDSNIIAFIGDDPIKESSSCTGQLVGDAFRQAIGVTWQEKRMLMFVFSDLAVRSEGTFVLRYRVFNIFTLVQGDVGHRVLAEVYGGPFKVYSTKDFPGLARSTALSKHLLDSGVKVIARGTERKRRRKEDIHSPPGAPNFTQASGSRAIRPSTVTRGAKHSSERSQTRTKRRASHKTDHAGAAKESDEE